MSNQHYEVKVLIFSILQMKKLTCKKVNTLYKIVQHRKWNANTGKGSTQTTGLAKNSFKFFVLYITPYGKIQTNFSANPIHLQRDLG